MSEVKVGECTELGEGEVLARSSVEGEQLKLLKNRARSRREEWLSVLKLSGNPDLRAKLVG